MDSIGEYEAWKAKQKQAKVGQAAVVLGSTKDQPDQLAGDLNLASEFGKVTGNPVPPAPLVRDNNVVFQSLIDKKRAETILSSSPRLTEWLTNTENATLAKDDLEGLSRIETVLGATKNSLNRATLSVPQTINQFTASEYAQDAADLKRSFGDILYDERTPLFDANGKEVDRAWVGPGDLLGAAWRYYDSRIAGGLAAIGVTDDPAKEAAAFQMRAEAVRQKISSMAMSPGAQVVRDKMGTINGTWQEQLVQFGQIIADDPAGFTSFIGQVAAESLPALGVSTAVGVATRNPTAAATTMGALSGVREYGSSAGDVVAQSGYDLSTPEGALAAISDEALMRRANEVGQTRALIIGALDGLSGNLAGKALAENPVGNMFLQSLTQAGLGSGGEALGQYASGQDFSLSDVLLEGIAEFATTPVEVGGMAVTKVREGQSKARAAQDRIALFQELSGQAVNSKLRARMPDRFRQFVETATANGPVENVFVPAEQFQQYFQSVGIDPMAIVDEMDGVTREDLDAALANGGDLRIPTATYAAKIAGSEHDAFLMENMRFDPTEMTAKEAADFNARVDDVMQEMWAEAEDVRQEDERWRSVEDKIHDEVVSSARMAGLSTEEAMTNVQTVVAFYRTRAVRMGLTTEEYLDRHPLPGIKGSIPQGMQFKNVDELNRTLAEARNRRAPAADKRQSLLQFIDGYGGINDVGGELSARDASVIKQGVGKKNLRLARDDGGAGQGSLLGPNLGGKKYGADDVAQAAIEAGFMADNPLVMEYKAAMLDGGQIPDITRALWDAIDAELQGNKQVSDQENVPADTARLDEIEQYLNSLGVDLSNTDDEIRAAIEADQAAPAQMYGQTATIRRGTETLMRYGLDPTKRYSTREVAAALEARQRKKYGMIERGDYSDKASKRIASWMVDETLFEVEQAQANPMRSAVGWYSTKFQSALDALGAAFPEFTGTMDTSLPGVALLGTQKNARDFFTALMAITSDGAKVADNFRFAAGAYEAFRQTGRIDTNVTFGGERNSSMRGNLQNIQDFLDAVGPDRMTEVLLRKDTISNLKKIAKAEGRDFSSDYKASMELPYSALIFGPKLGAFYANLMGDTGYLTMDRWWSRSFNRYRGTLLQKPTEAGLVRFKDLVTADRKLNAPASEMTDDEALLLTIDYVKSYKAKGYKDGTEIEKAANTLYKAAFEGLEDQPFNASDREFMINTTVRAQAMLKRRGVDLTIADIQAVLWYYEKRLYGELGARQTQDISYEEIARTVVAGRDPAAGSADPVDGGAGDETFLDQGSDREAEGGNGPALDAVDDAFLSGGSRTFYQFAGPQSNTADIHALATAKDRIDAGANEEIVRRETGWFRGPDLKWRYEITDEDARLRRPVTLDKSAIVITQLRDGSFQAKLNAAATTAATADEARATLEAWIDKRPERGFNPDNIKDGAEFALGDILQHDRVYAAYPDLALIPVKIDNSLDAWGQVSGYGSEMTLNPARIKAEGGPDALLKTLLHELQHLIQRREGFARGGNTGMAKEVVSALVKLSQQQRQRVGQYENANWMDFKKAEEASQMVGYTSMFQDFQRLIDYARMDRPSGVFRHIRNATQWLHTPALRDGGALQSEATELYRRLYALPRSGPKRNAFLRDYAFDLAQLLRKAVPEDRWQMLSEDPRKTASLVKAMERESAKAGAKLKPFQVLKGEAKLAEAQTDKARYASPFEIYQLLAGEVEARNTENRSDMTEAQRRETSPNATMTADQIAYSGMKEKRNLSTDEVIVVLQNGEITSPYVANSEGPANLPAQPEMVEVDGIELPLNPDGTVTLYQGTTADAADQILKTGILRSAAEPTVYLTTAVTADTGYGDGTVVAIDVRPDMLRLDDEFPDGRADFAIDMKAVRIVRSRIIAGGSGQTYNQSADHSAPHLFAKSFQQNDQGPRGAIEFNMDGSSLIRLFEQANLSTMQHELGHLFLTMMQRDVASGDAGSVAEYEVIKTWWRDNAAAVAADGNKAMPDAKLTAEDVQRAIDAGSTGDIIKDAAVDVGMQEQWARGYEAYLMEGKSPSIELRGAFEKFRSWMISVYKSLVGLNVKISPEIRAVFDRMLATDEEIAKAKQSSGGASQVFTTAEQMGLTAEQFDRLMKLRTQSEDEAKARLQVEIMAPIRRESEKAYMAEKAVVTEEITRRVNAMPVFRALEWLGNRRWLGDTQPDALPDMRMSKDTLVARYGEGILKTLPRGMQTIYTVEGGMDPDEVAGWFGFDSGDKMLRLLERAPKRGEAIKAEVEAEMYRRHGDPLKSGEIESKALDAIHTDRRGEWLAAELKAVADVAGVNVALTMKDARASARLTINRMKVRDATASNRFLAAERKAGEEAARLGAMLSREKVWMDAARRKIASNAKAAVRGDATVNAVAGQIDKANTSTGNYNDTVKRLIEAKRRQLMNHALFMEARNAADEVAKAEGYVQKLNKASMREKIAGAGRRENAQTDYLAAIDEIVDRYDFRKMSAKAEDRRGALLAFVDAMKAAGRENQLAIPDAVLRAANRTPYKTLTVEELRGVVDSLKNIQHIALRWNDLIDAKNKAKLDEAVADIAAAFDANMPKRPPGRVKTAGEGLRHAGRQFLDLVLNASTILREIDGFKDMGSAYRYLKSPIDEAMDRLTVRKEKAAADMEALYSVYSKEDRRRMAVREYIPALGYSLSKWERIAVALNTGNEGNMQRLTDPQVNGSLSPLQVTAVLGSLDARDADFVQSVWDYVGTFRDDIGAR